MYHGNISTKSIFVSPCGYWRLAGMSFVEKAYAEQVRVLSQYIIVHEYYTRNFMRKVLIIFNYLDLCCI